MENTEEVISKLKSLLKQDGILCILDYNHALIEWSPLPPKSMLKFFDAFLKWRADAGMDNEIGNHIAQILQGNDMKVIYNQDQSEYIERGLPEFESQINIWTVVPKRGASKWWLTSTSLTQSANRLRASIRLGATKRRKA